MPTALDQRLASRIHQQWITTLGRVDTITRAVVVVYNRLGRELLGLLAADPADRVSRAARAIDTAWANVGRLVRSRFEGLAMDAHKRSARVLRQTIPVRWFAVTEPQLAFAEQIADEPVAPKLTDEEKRELFEQSVFPPPTPEQVEEYLATSGPGGMTWDERLSYWSGPTREQMLGEMLAGAAEGEGLNVLRKRILPLVDGIRYKAQRIVRTEGRRVAERAQMTAYGQCGDLIGAMQIIATLDARTRPEHALRHGRIYHREQDGQYRDEYGQVLPDLPDAPNCRCFASPVLAPVTDDPAIMADFRNAAKEHIPDPASYDRWFSQATVAERRIAVGAKRYRIVAGRRESPEWVDFLDERGQLVDVNRLRGERLVDRHKRMAAAKELVQKREAMLQQTKAGMFLGTPLPKEVRKIRDWEGQAKRKEEQEDYRERMDREHDRLEKKRQAVLAAGKRTQQNIERLEREMEETGNALDEGFVERARVRSQVDWWKDSKEPYAQSALEVSERELAEHEAKMDVLLQKAQKQSERHYRLTQRQKETVLGKLTLPKEQRAKFEVEILGKSKWAGEKMQSTLDRKDVVPVTSTAIKDNAKEAAKALGKITHRDLAIRDNGRVKVAVGQIAPEAEQRACAWDDQIRMTNADDPGTHAHEMGHVLEFGHGQAWRMASGFRSIRCGAEPPVHLKTKFPKHGYKDYEWGRGDDWFRLYKEGSSHPYYVGKHYDYASEILSMGTEKLYRDPMGLAENDPEFFRLVVGVLDGGLLR